jgi:hypothetical protein
MKGGDISNESSPRVIVTIDVVVNSEVVESKRLLRSDLQERKVKSLNHLALVQLWNVANKYGLSVELAGFESEMWTQDDLDKLMDKLDHRGANPFNYAELYTDIDDFVGELPYRSNLRGVVDLPERVMRYGSMGIELQNL